MSIFVTIGPAASYGGAGILSSVPRVSEAITVAATASTASALSGEFWSVTAEVDVYVSFGSAPTGAGTQRHRVKSGSTRDFAASANGEKIAFATS